MAIKAPKWVAKLKAVPTAKGWVTTTKTGKKEVIKSSTFTAEQIAEWYAERSVQAAPAPQMLNEAPSVERTLHSSEIEHHYGSEEVEEE